MMPARQGRPTLGVLPAYQVYEGTIPHSFLVPLFRGIRSAARDQDCNLLLACGVVSHPLGPDTVHPAWPVLAPDIEDPRQGTDFVPVGPWNTQGLIVVAPLLSETRSRYIQELIAAGHPVVFVSAGEVGPTVVTDNEAGIRQALTHLVAHGHQRIAYIAGHEAGLEDSEQRLRAYESFIREHGLASDPRLVAYGFHNQRSGRWAMERILESGVKFTAVLASNDESAIGALHALRQAGRQVPDDVALIGFDDRLEAAAQLPPLTTVQYPIFEIGYQSVGLLLEHIRDRGRAAQTVRVPTRLIIRQSCGCQPGGFLPPGPTVMVGHRRARDVEPAPPEPAAERLPATSGEWLERGPRVAAQPSTPKTLPEAEAALTRAMTSAVLANARKLSHAEVQTLCRRLIEGLSATVFSPSGRDLAPFRSALTELLQSVEAVDDEANAWEGAVSILEAELPALLRKPLKRRRSASRRIAALLRQARIAIYESARRRYSRYLVQHIQAADQMGRMTARLHAALDETQILATLEECLPDVGLRSALVIFFEPEQADSVAWSVVHSGRQGETKPRRFHTRAFPPPGPTVVVGPGRARDVEPAPPSLYPAEASFQLALLPLIVQEEQLGYVAFDVADPPQGTANLNPCADIVWQLAAALRSARLYREAAEGKQLAEKANQLKSRFLSMVSHELRTPLNLIVGLSEMLLREQASADPAAPDRQRHDLELIHASTQHLGGLIRDVLDLASSEAGELKLLREPVDLREALRPVLVTGEQLAREKRLAWQVHLPDPAPWVWGDRTRLRQVVLNLVNNAVKFTERGTITLEVKRIDDFRLLTADWENQQSAIHNPQSQEWLLISVSDTGLGIPLSEQRVIFDEFHQSERTATRGYGGLGLGLAICKRLVELHGGEIGVHSSGEEQAGSTFYFTLPLWEAHSASLQGIGDARSAPEPDERPQTVLLLTEAATGGERLREYLTRQGFDVEVRAVDGTDDWLSTLFTSPPGAVVLDLTLASEPGWEVLKALKSHPATQDIPVLFYSLAQERDSGSLLEVDYLTKPLGRTELAQALARHGTLEAGAATADQPRTILIVDDDPGTLEIHSRIVRSQSPTYRVLEAHNGREALALLRETRADLVLLDLMMPELDGFGVLQAMRENENTRSTPVIVLTAQVLSESDMTRLNQGVATVLEKGLFSVEETLAHVEAALARNRKLGSETQRLARKAMAYLHTHYPEPVSRESVARYVGVSEDYLTRCFHQEVGVTPMTYLNRYRINRAKALLEAGRESVEEIAVAVGFSDAHHFRRVFRREVGLSPRAYQRARAAGRP